MRNFLLAAVVQFSQYLTLTVNFRAIAHEQYAAAAMTASIAALLAYVIVQRITHDTSAHTTLFGMMVGGALADMVGIYLTREW